MMVKTLQNGAYLLNGKQIIEDNSEALALVEKVIGKRVDKEEASKNTMAYSILEKHNTSGSMEKLKIKFDAMASHDITYVGIVQTAKASGLDTFPIPYVLTNCHNSLCAVGGTINEDDHLFGLSAAKKYGGIYVPAHQAVIHQYMREMMSGCGKMILGSDSHTRYGALGTMAIGEGGPELVKQLLRKTYDLDMPEVVGVYLTGKPLPGVGPQDIALTIIKEVFECGYVKNKVMEFVGDGIADLNVEYRNGIDVMTTETTCLTSIWCTDEKVKEYYKVHGREADYTQLSPGDVVYYDGMITVDLSTIKPMIALPFHPSNAYSIAELNANLSDILHKEEQDGKKQLGNQVDFKLKDKIVNGRLKVDQGVIAGCAGGTYDNLCDTADILRCNSMGNDEFSLSIYPSSQPIMYSLVENGAVAEFIASGATVRTAFCGPCFGAGDVPANNGLSIRHSTRNFPNREGSKPSGGQIASVALMDARSIAATAVNNGILTSATDLEVTYTKPEYHFNSGIYEKRVYNGYGKPQPLSQLKFGPNIAEWPKMSELTENLVLKVVSVILDPVTTTDELIPSGETSSYRSNPLKLAEFTLSRKDPNYVTRAKELQKIEFGRLDGKNPIDENSEVKRVFEVVNDNGFANVDPVKTGIGSVIYAIKPGDGSAREQAASCQKVLGGWANIAKEYATKRYRSNLINWGMLPFLYKGEDVPFENGDYVFVANIREAVAKKKDEIMAYIVKDELIPITLRLASLTDDERQIILDGCLINFYKQD